MVKSFHHVSLSKVLTYCSEKINYYSGKGSDLKNYGYIDVGTVRNNYSRFVKKGFKIIHNGYTSGTTGRPSKFLRDFHSIAAEQYFQDMHFGWKNKYKVIFRGEKLFKLEDKPSKIYRIVPFINEMYISSYHISDESLKPVVEKLKNIENKCLWAYPSSAYMLAEYCIRNNQEIEFDLVVTSSEKITEYQLEVIEKAFHCRVKDWYGLAERTCALYRCEYGHYHEVTGYSHVEYLQIDEGAHEIVGTTLHNKVMPLVRYRTGDIVSLSKEICQCGSIGTNILEVHGRKSSFIELSGKKIPECLFGCLLKSTKNVLEFQVVQTKEKRIIYKIVKNNKFSPEDEKLLLGTVYSLFPQEICSVQYVDKIQREKNGKIKLVVNENNESA